LTKQLDWGQALVKMAVEMACELPIPLEQISVAMKVVCMRELRIGQEWVSEEMREELIWFLSIEYECATEKSR
jgi:hypothetical protein